MKLSLSTILISGLLAVLFSSCDKEATVTPQVSSTTLPGTGTGGGTTPTPPVGTTDYQPLTTGTTWRYQETQGTDVDTSTLTVTGRTRIINTKTYYVIEENSKDGKDSTYYYKNNHNYITNSEDFADGVGTETLYLNDNEAVGYTWTGTAASNPLASGTYSGKIVEKGISKTVLGKTYTDVIHTQVVLKLTLLGIANATINCDIYVAKGIGIIQFDTNDGTDTSSNKIIDYTIK